MTYDWSGESLRRKQKFRLAAVAASGLFTAMLCVLSVGGFRF